MAKKPPPDAKKKTTAEIEDKNRNLAIEAALAMHSQRATDIVILDLQGLVDYADYFVIGSASSLTRMRGVIRTVEKNLAALGGKRLNQPDYEGNWVLADYGDILVHVFENDAREFYKLEDLWGDAPRIEWEDKIPAHEEE